MTEPTTAHWIALLETAAFDIARDRGLERSLAAELPAAARAGLREGDRLVVFLVDQKGFAATVEVAAPGAVTVHTETLCAAGDLEPLVPLAPFLKLPEGVDGAHPGTLLPLRKADYDMIRIACHARQRGHPRPPGVPPNEAERPPPRPPKR